MPRTRKPKPIQTTAQQLSALIKSVRQILRKDKGLNGDADRLPLLTWVMFLKFLDDLEIRREEEAAMNGEAYEPLIEAPYRWRDWAARRMASTVTSCWPSQTRTRRQARTAGAGRACSPTCAPWPTAKPTVGSAASSPMCSRACRTAWSFHLLPRRDQQDQSDPLQ
ncbi:MAG: hypothetical protein R3F08_13355 [Dokdonella sp.]